jgi:hypothetical protein
MIGASVLPLQLYISEVGMHVIMVLMLISFS